jgi:hypothetical protein
MTQFMLIISCKTQNTDNTALFSNMKYVNSQRGERGAKSAAGRVTRPVVLGFPRLGSFHGRGTRPDELRK